MRVARVHGLAARLAVAYVVVMALLGLSWVVAARALDVVHVSFAHVVEYDDHLTDLVDQMRAAMLDQETGARGYVLTGASRYLEPYRAGERALALARNRARPLLDTPQERRLVGRLDQSAARWQAWARHTVAEARATARTTKTQDVGKRLFDAFRAAEAAVITQLAEQRARALARSEQVATHASVLLGILALAALGVVSLIGWLLVRSVVSPVRVFVQAARRMSLGNLDSPLPPMGVDELAHLSAAMEIMRVQLQLRNTLALSLASTLDLTFIFPALAALLQRALPFTRLSIASMDASGVLVHAYSTGSLIASLPIGAPIPLEDTASGEAFRTQRAVVRPDLLALPPEQRGPLSEALLAMGLRSVLAVPLLSHGEITGVLTLVSAVPGAYDEAGSAQLATLTPLLAAALANARLYQQVVQTNDQLARASQVKSEFLANMSHELRTPLNAIIGFSEVLADQTFGPLAPRQQRYVGNILESGRHLLALINDVLDLSKVEAGKMELHLVDLSLHPLLAQVREQMAPLAAKKEIALEVAPVAAEVLVRVDRARLVQILYNLLSNAIKFTPAGGRVSVRATPSAGVVEIAVTDTGIGIAPEDQARIFEEFAQVDSSLGRQQQGTGLGLTLTRRLVALHGGTLTLESAPGAGSTFTLTLPRSDETPAELTPPGPRGSVLVVEDDHGAFELLSLALADAGYTAHWVQHGEAVVARARALRPVAITLDILLGEESGWPVLEQLRADPETRAIPVVIVSVTEEQARGFALGASAYLVKPVGRQDLLTALAHLIDGGDVRGAKRRVLAVDDQLEALELIALALRGSPYELLRASSGAEALEILAREEIDLLLVDLEMGPLSGFEVIEAVVSNPRTSALPIVVLSARELSAADRARLTGHVTATFSKSGFDKEGFLRELQRATRRDGPHGLAPPLGERREAE